ncbi:MAG: diacylglycerol kinase family protein [Mycoplasmataceae bacterium]|nr:diacylglycerol kinase family protein [Mycoplasmataceae bacterium]
MEKRKKKWAWLKKFGYAFRGLFTSLKEETSLVVHAVIGIIVLIVAALLHKQMNPIDWAIIILVIGIVIGMELLNTAIENLVDIVAFKYNYNAKKIKDISAAATLVLTVTSVIVGLIIFIPKIIAVFS